MADMVFYPENNFYFEKAVWNGAQYVTGFGSTLDELNVRAARYGTRYVLISRQEAEECIRAAAMLPVREITEADYNVKFYELPPVGLAADKQSESFKSGAVFCLDIVYIYARLGDRFFMLRDVGSLPHQEIINRVNVFCALSGNGESA